MPFYNKYLSQDPKVKTFFVGFVMVLFILVLQTLLSKEKNQVLIDNQSPKSLQNLYLIKNQQDTIAFLHFLSPHQNWSVPMPEGEGELALSMQVEGENTPYRTLVLPYFSKGDSGIHFKIQAHLEGFEQQSL